MNWHTASPKETAERIGTDLKTGLSGETAKRRLELHGENRTRTREHMTLMQHFGEQLSAVLVVILFAAAVISAVIAINDPKGGNWLEALFIVLITLLTALVGALIDTRLDRMSERLGEINAARSRVLRDGVVTVVPASTLVPGDIIMLEAGELIPADGRLISSQGLVCDQSAITGDSAHVTKDAQSLPHVTVPIAQRDNLVYAGCSVVAGHGVVLITETGMDTEAGKLARLVAESDEPDTPLKKQLAQMGKNTAAAGLIVCLVLFIIGFSRRHPNDMKAIEVFLTCMALAVAIIPEWTRSIVRFVNLRGALDMVKRGIIVRDLNSIERLSGVTVICTGKGGTVAGDSMDVTRVWTPGGRITALGGEKPPEVQRLLRYAALCCATDGEVEAQGSPRQASEMAIIRALMTNGESKKHLDLMYPRVGIEQEKSSDGEGGAEAIEAALPVGVSPYDSERKQMTTVHRIKGRIVAITRGDPDGILPLCSNADRERAQIVCDRLGSSAMRVVAVAYRVLEEPVADPAPCEDDVLTFLGVLGMSSTPDDDTRESIEVCEMAGIRAVMATGDQPATAEAVARSAGILREGEQVATGAQIAAMSDKELENNIRKYSVYAGISAEDKLRIVSLWRQSGETVMVSGSSVADVPVLHEADVGCAMGLMGTGVARGTAGISVTDDSFASMICAVNSGRTIYDNIRKAVCYILQGSLSRAVAVGAAILLTGGTSLLPLQLMLSFLATGFVPALAMSYEPPEQGVMYKQPRRRDSRFFSGNTVMSIIVNGLVPGAAALAAFFIGREISIDTARTMTFAVLTFGQLALALSVRSGSSVIGEGFMENRKLLYVVGLCAAAVLLIMLMPVGIFVFTRLTIGQAGIIAALSLAPFVVSELVKPMIGAFAYN
ncbi:MAG: cation-translocating P-type ATPase [Ruminococcaceae bacterium]|nr:cation-translocating P-type ATPase [Oscillospiraceae bacterium]